MGDVKPQDRKPKKGSVTVAGVKVSVDLETLSDWDIVEGVATIQDDTAGQAEKLVASVRVMRRIFGDQYEPVKAALRAEHGGALTADDMGAALQKVFESLNPNS